MLNSFETNREANFSQENGQHTISHLFYSHFYLEWLTHFCSPPRKQDDDIQSSSTIASSIMDNKEHMNNGSIKRNINTCENFSSLHYNIFF